jgi:endonuclease III
MPINLGNLFKKAPDLDSLNKLSIEEIKKLIYPIGFYNEKAKHLKKLPLIIKQEYNNKIPNTLEELLKIPGVGRKTANLVLAVAFKKPAICVDIHVHRISNRLGLINTSKPLETELELIKIIPKKYWRVYNAYLVSYGQNHCFPILPRCSDCIINKYCHKKGVKKHR